jgi:glycosyltransferase involved in cell wall biosynthesis
VWNYVEWGGAQIHLISLMKYAKDDWDITVLLPENSSDELLGFMRDLRVDIQFLKHSIDLSEAHSMAAKLKRQLRRVRSEIEIARHLRSQGMENSVVHIEVAPWQSWQLLALLRASGARVFVTAHNTLTGGPFWRRLVWKTRLRFLFAIGALNIFAANTDTWDRLAEWIPSKYHPAIPITYTAIDPIEIEQAIVPRESRDNVPVTPIYGEVKKTVLCVGQFIDRKGRWIFLEAAARVSQTRADVQFIWLTPRPPSDEELLKASSFGLGESFRLVVSATVGNDRVSILRFIAAADIFVLPSILEGLPISLLEAMALGVPSISTNVNSIPEAIIDGETGVLVSPNNSEELAEAIETLIGDQKLRKRLAANGREHVLRRFDERNVAAIIWEEYKTAN